MSQLITFKFYHQLRVRWAEVDPQGVVFNGNYLTYFDVGITEYFRHLGLPYPEAFSKYGSDFFVKKASIEYHSPARFDDLIKVHVRIGRIGNSSIQFLIEIDKEDKKIVSGEIIYVNFDAATQKPTSVHEDLREMIMQFENI